jgi:hypothetical protein
MLILNVCSQKQVAEPGQAKEKYLVRKGRQQKSWWWHFLSVLLVIYSNHWTLGDGPLVPPRAMGVSASWTRVGRRPATRACPAIPPLTVPSSSADPVPRWSRHKLKGSLRRDFRVQVFFMNQFLRASEYPFFMKICGNICNFVFIASVKQFTGLNKLSPLLFLRAINYCRCC